MRDSRSKQLRQAVERLLIPHIRANGFEHDSREVSKQGVYRHLIKPFLRWRGDNLELLDIQFEKHGWAKFVLNFGVVPPGGVEYYGYHYSQQDASIGGLPRQARLYAGRYWRMRWFGFPLLRIPLLRNPSAESIVRHAIQLFPQVEAWLKDGVKGPNVGVMELSSKASPSPSERV